MLGRGRKEVLDSLSADVVGFFESACVRIMVLSVALKGVGIGVLLVGEEEGLCAGRGWG